jgi:hypothetical protein
MVGAGFGLECIEFMNINQISLTPEPYFIGISYRDALPHAYSIMEHELDLASWPLMLSCFLLNMQLRGNGTWNECRPCNEIPTRRSRYGTTAVLII